MNAAIEKIKSAGVVPVIVIEKAEDILPLGEILCECNLPIAEITFRSEGAAEAVNLLKKKIPEMLVGAGTLLTKEAIDRAADAGSDFFVSPGLNPKNVEYALNKGLFMIPGVSNPSLVEQAMDMGLTNLKFFPASVSGGTGMLKAFASVYPDAFFMPTGGINAVNISEYLALRNVHACGGSWMVKSDMISSHQWDGIRKLVKEAVNITAEIISRKK